jgi:hypothetical protein
MKTTLKGALIAAAAASLFGCSGSKKDSKTAADPGMSGATSDMVQCAGINECSAKGACAAADGSHSCAGKNACKGKGWVKASASDCTAKGGTVMAAK